MIEIRRAQCRKFWKFAAQVTLSRGEPSRQIESHRYCFLAETAKALLYSYVEPAVNRQPGFRRGAVEQSAFNNTHTSKKLVRSFFSDGRADGRIGPTNGGRTHGWRNGAHGRTDRQTNKRLIDGRTNKRARQWTINTKTDVWMNRTDWQRQAS